MEEEIIKEENPIEPKETRGRDENGLFVEGNTIGQLGGRPKETPENKIAKKAMKELIEEYREKLSEALPQISPVLVEKALKGDMSAIRELHEVIGSHAPKQNDIDLKANINVIIPQAVAESFKITSNNELDTKTGSGDKEQIQI